MNVPNLDAMSADDLWSFWIKAQSMSKRAAARLMFPDRPKAYVRVSLDVLNYSINKACAVKARLSGDIQTATIYETICDRIYSDLPEYARW